MKPGLAPVFFGLCIRHNRPIERRFHAACIDEPVKEPPPQVINQIVNNITIIEQKVETQPPIDGRPVTAPDDHVGKNACAAPDSGSVGATRYRK
jgi:hypothetical protein